ncbi:MAG TPA: hypothetical protein VI386_19195, partial [Candidatus Sulfotelmatobacter sp.]
SNKSCRSAETRVKGESGRPRAMRFLLLISDAGRADTYATNIRLWTLAHMMFYTPKINTADWGANMDNSPIVIDPRGKNDPEPINTFMLLTGAWSDGSPAPLS